MQGEVGPAAVALTDLLIRALRPCEAIKACDGCTNFIADDGMRCGWCGANDRCLPRRETAVSGSDCEGAFSYSSDECSSFAGGDEPGESGEIKRYGIGILVVNVGDVDLKAARFYADLNIFLHVETNPDGSDKLYPRRAAVDPSLKECNGLLHWRKWEPSEEDLEREDKGLNLVNVDRLRTVQALRHNGSLDHFRVQSNFYFRTNVSYWPVNTETLEIVLELQRESFESDLQAMFCVMPEYTGLASSVRFPGAIDNQRLTYEANISAACGPPFLRPQPMCVEDVAAWREQQEQSDHTRQPPISAQRSNAYFDKQCECDTVSDYLEGYDRESCGCQGGRAAASRLIFKVLYRTPEIGASISAFMAPVFIMFTNLFTYLIPPRTIESRFSLSSSGLIALVLFHAGLKSQTPLAGVLTAADRVMIACYGVIVASFSSTALILILTSEGHHNTAQRVFVWLRILGPSLSLFFFTASIFSQLPTNVLTYFVLAIILAVFIWRSCMFFVNQLKLPLDKQHPALRSASRVTAPLYGRFRGQQIADDANFASLGETLFASPGVLSNNVDHVNPYGQLGSASSTEDRQGDTSLDEKMADGIHINFHSCGNAANHIQGNWIPERKGRCFAA